jgi:hypothetical protein
MMRETSCLSRRRAHSNQLLSASVNLYSIEVDHKKKSVVDIFSLGADHGRKTVHKEVAANALSIYAEEA